MKDHLSQWIASGLTCHDVTERTTDYLEERLPILTKVRVGLHLASCANCRAYVKQIVLVRDALALFPKQIPPRSIDFVCGSSLPHPTHTERVTGPAFRA